MIVPLFENTVEAFDVVFLEFAMLLGTEGMVGVLGLLGEDGIPGAAILSPFDPLNLQC